MHSYSDIEHYWRVENHSPANLFAIFLGAGIILDAYLFLILGDARADEYNISELRNI